MLILATLFCLGGIGASVLGPMNLDVHIFGKGDEAHKPYGEVLQTLIDQKESLEKAEGAEAMKEEIAAINEQLEVLPSPLVYTVLQGFYYGILPILALALLILAFMKKSLVNKIAPLLVVASVILWVLAPAIEGSSYGPASPKQIAMVIAVLMTLHAVTSFLSFRFIKKETA